MHWSLAADWPWGVSAGLAVVIVGVVGVLARRFLRAYDDQAKALLSPAYSRVAALEADKAYLERKLEVAIRLLRQNGIDATEALP